MAANVHEAAEALSRSGAIVEEVELGWTAEMHQGWDQIWGVFMAAYFGHHLEEWRDQMDPDVVKLMEVGFATSAVEYKQLEVVRSRQWVELAKVFTHFDALITPTVAQPPPPFDEKAMDDMTVDDHGRLVSRFMCVLFNMVPQCPVLSVPSGFSAGGLPTGVSICGRRFDDPRGSRNRCRTRTGSALARSATSDLIASCCHN